MASSEGYGFRMPFVSFRRPIPTVKNYLFDHSDLTHHVGGDGGGPPSNLDSFQRLVSAHLRDLSLAKSDDFLSISWLRRLLDSLTKCLEEFTALLTENELLLSKPPADKLAADLFDRSIKAMDILNATRDGLSTIRAWQKHLEIVQCALDGGHKTVGEGQLRRARKALTELSLVMNYDGDGDNNNNSSKSLFSHRNRSFVRSRKDHHHSQSPAQKRHARSSSWSVSLDWSASKQLKSIANGLFPPRTNEIAATNGLAVPIFTMSFVLAFSSWALVAAVPCQDNRVDQINVAVPRHFSWSTPAFLIHSRVLDELKKRERRSSNGLLKEIGKMEKCLGKTSDFLDSSSSSSSSYFPMSEESKEELRMNMRELGSVVDSCNNELDPLERGLRQVSRKIVSCRNHGLTLLGKKGS